MSTITIGCRLPTGLILEVGDKRVELAGQRQMQEESEIVILGSSMYGTTEVDESFWEAFRNQVGDKFEPISSGAIFVAKNEKEAKAIAKDLKGKETGHEPSKQEDGKIKKMD